MNWLRRRRAKKRAEKAGLAIEATDELEVIGIASGYPLQWNVCEFCGAYSWIFPPHMFDPCPLPTSMTESAGLRMDSERMTQTRIGVHLEEATRRLNELFESREEGEE